MKIDFKKFEENLQQYRVTDIPKASDHGVCKAIQYVWNHTDTKEVDFDSFTMTEGLRALYELYFLPHSDDQITPSDRLAMKDNFWEINANIDNVILALHRNENKVFEEDEADFI